MAMGVCGWICACLCCFVCCGGLFIMIFSGTLFVGLLSIFESATRCEPAELNMAESCKPLTEQILNATYGFEPVFFGAQPEMNRHLEVCQKASKCWEQVTCLGARLTYSRVYRQHCEVYSFIKDEFSECAKKLEKSEKSTGCIQFLLQKSEKCGGWLENQKCIEEKIKEHCGLGMEKKYITIANAFYMGSCKRHRF